MGATPWSRHRNFRSPLGALATLAAIALVAVVAGLFWPPPATLRGEAIVIDGDTLRIGETRIRLLGLDAVELDQTCADRAGVAWPCGQESRSFLAGLTGHKSVRCAADGRDRYRRVLARCAVADADIGEQIVRAGWAVGDLEYGLAVAEARLNSRGIWGGTFDDPAEWRRRHGAETFDLWQWFMGLVGR